MCDARLARMGVALPSVNPAPRRAVSFGPLLRGAVSFVAGVLFGLGLVATAGAGVIPRRDEVMS